MSQGFAPVSRQSVSDSVFHELRAAVLDGRFAPGELLPPERALAESFAVNRHAVREAVKRLQQAGFVRVVHGGGTAVLDVRRTAGLDLLAHLATAEGEPLTRLIRDGLEMRRCVGVEAARLAATRADAKARRRILAAATAYTGVDGSGGDGTDRAFWAEVVDASDNLAFRLALNSLVHAIDAHPELMDELLADDRTDATPHVDLAAAIADGDAHRAAEVADAILGQAVAALERHTRRAARRRTRSA